MLVDEMPGWLRERGFDPRMPAAFGGSMGGFGSLLLAGAHPDLLSSLDVLSPAVAAGGAVFVRVGKVGPSASLDSPNAGSRVGHEPGRDTPDG